MEAKMEELTMRVAELQGENEALTEALMKSMSSTSNTQPAELDTYDDDQSDGLPNSVRQLRMSNAELSGRVKELEAELFQRHVVPIQQDAADAQPPIPGNTQADNTPNENISASNLALCTFDELLKPSGVVRVPESLPSDVALCQTISGIHKGNVLSVCFVHSGKGVITGGVDRFVCLTRLSDMSTAKLQLSAPVVSCRPSPDTQTGLVAIGTLDGNVLLLATALAIPDNNNEIPYLALAATTTDGTAQLNDETPSPLHSKHVTDVAWSSCGRWLASSSRDETVIVQRVITSQQTGSEVISLNKEHTLQCAGVPETIVFVPANGYIWLAIGPRTKTSALLLVCIAQTNAATSSSDNQAVIAPGYTREVVMFDGETTSTVLAMVAAPHDRPLLLCATDVHKHILVHAGTGRVIRELYGHSADSYSKPSVAWHSDVEWVLSNSQMDHELLVWSLGTGHVVGRLKGHTASVRDVCVDAYSGMVASVSFDGTCRVWSHLATTAPTVQAFSGDTAV